jgi:hypothetical protein
MDLFYTLSRIKSNNTRTRINAADTKVRIGVGKQVITEIITNAEDLFSQPEFFRSDSIQFETIEIA